jgi:hypothetical protein
VTTVQSMPAKGRAEEDDNQVGVDVRDRTKRFLLARLVPTSTAGFLLIFLSPTFSY